MQSFYSFRLTSHALFYGTVVCLLPPFRGEWPVFALIAGLTLLAGLAATNCSGLMGRLLLGLLPALALLYPVTNVFTYALAGILAAYVAASLAAARFEMALWKYKQEVIVALAVHGAFFLLLMGVFSGQMEYRPVMLMSGATLLFVLLALRALRLGQTPTGGWQLWCAGIFALPFLGGGLAAGMILLILPVLGRLLSVVGGGFAGGMYLYTKFFDMLVNSSTATTSTLSSVEALTGYTMPEEYDAPANEVIGHVRVWRGELPWGYFLLLICGFALILLSCWLIWRGSKSVERGKPETNLMPEEITKEKSRRRNRKKRGGALSNRDQIRGIYQDYLRFLSQNGICPERCDTTADISRASAAILKESDELLRRLYRRARYSTGGFTDEDVKTAAEAFKCLTREENLIQQGKRT